MRWEGDGEKEGIYKGVYNGLFIPKCERWIHVSVGIYVSNVNNNIHVLWKEVLEFTIYGKFHGV